MSAGYYTVDGRRTTLSKMLADNAHDHLVQREIRATFERALHYGAAWIGGGALASIEVRWHAADEHSNHVADGERDRDCRWCC